MALPIFPVQEQDDPPLHRDAGRIFAEAMVCNYEQDYPWPRGSRAASKPAMIGPYASNIPHQWKAARTRQLPNDWPIEPEAMKCFKEQHRRNMTKAESSAWKTAHFDPARAAAVAANDAATCAQWMAGPQTLPYYPPVYPLPFASSAFNDIARPQRRWVLSFPDLRSLALAFGPSGGNFPSGIFPPLGPKRTAELTPIRFIQVTWIDDSRKASYLQPPHKSEWAFEAMSVLLKATKEMNRNRLMIRIYFLDRSRQNPLLNLDSPGIFHLLQIRARHLVIVHKQRLWTDRPLSTAMQKHIVRSVEGTKPMKFQGNELQSFGASFQNFDIRNYKAYCTGGTRRRSARILIPKQMAYLERKYRTKHHRTPVNKRRFAYLLRKARVDRQQASQAGAAGAALAPYDAEVTFVQDLIDQLDFHWDSNDIRRDLAVHREQRDPNPFVDYHIRPEQI